MSLSKYYKQAVLIPSGLIILGYIIFVIYDLTIGPGKDYKSEWLTADSVDIYVLGLILAHCVIVALLFCTIFLNEYPKVRASRMLSFLSWFLLPGTYFFFLLSAVVKAIYHHVEVLGSLILMLSVTLPFMIGLIYTFAKYRRGDSGPL